MSRLPGMACAAAVVFAVAGCVFDSFPTPIGSGCPQQVVSGSSNLVSAQLEEGLREAGVSFVTKRVGSEIRLAGRTASGQVFCIHLYGDKKAGAEKTLVRINWDRAADEPFWQMVLRLLATPASDSSDSSSAGDAGQHLRSDRERSRSNWHPLGPSSRSRPAR